MIAMPIVDGQYQAKISTTFRSTQEAIEAISEKIKKSKKVRISNVPMSILEKLLPLLKDKDVKIILPANAKPTDELKQVGSIAIQKAKIYKDYKGTNANLGSIYFSDRMFSIVWTEDEILEVDAMDYGKCVKCMAKMFDVGWRYSEKQK
jgi:ribosomal protein L30E